MDLLTTTLPNTLELSFLFMASAFILGALHALEPGHGKSVMAIFVMGTDADLKDALLLGLTIVISHVAVVIAFGILSIYLLKTLNVDLTHDIMSVLGGLILIAVGIWIIRKFTHKHEHAIDFKKSVIAIGLSTGLIPCPAALALLLLGISNNQVYAGLIYVLIFSLGLAFAIVLMSIIFVKSRNVLKRYVNSSKINKLPLISGFIIILIGIFTFIHPFIEHFHVL